MAQGKMKIKAKLPSGSKGKSEHSLKKNAVGTMKKGKRHIEPRKQKCKEMNQMKKRMEKMLSHTIEKSAIEKATANEPHSLRVLKDK